MTTVGDPLVGADLGGYRLGRKLGQGGMGAVYFGIHHLLEKEAAIKLLPTQVAQNEQYRKRFFREAKAASKLEHPNIVSVLDAGIADQYGTCYLVMQFCGGQSLRDLIAKGPLQLANALPIFYTMLDALIFAHDRGFIHRDVKPDNVLFALDGTPKLADFGLARDLESLSGLTASGQVLGTPNYMPLEQWDGHNLDARVDQYALGVLFYETLTCRRPVEAPTPTGMVAKLLKGDRTPITNWRTDLPQALIAVIDKMMALQADDRFGTLREAKRALIESVAGVHALPEPTITPAFPSPSELRARDTSGLLPGVASDVNPRGPLGFGGTYVDTDNSAAVGLDMADPSAATRTDAYTAPTALGGRGPSTINIATPKSGSVAQSRAPGQRPPQPGGRPQPARRPAGPAGRPGPRPGAPITTSSLGAPGTMHDAGEGLADDRQSAILRAWRERPNLVLGVVIAGALVITVAVLLGAAAFQGNGGDANANGNNRLALNPPGNGASNTNAASNGTNGRPLPNDGQHPGNHPQHPANRPQQNTNQGPPFNPNALPVPTVPLPTHHYDSIRPTRFLSSREADLARSVESLRSPLGALSAVQAVGDFDGDGVPDIALASNARPYRVAWFSLATDARREQVLASAEGFDTIVQLASGDFDGDGDIDLVTLEDTGRAPPPGPPGAPATMHVVRLVYNAIDSNARGANAGTGRGRMAVQVELDLDATPVAIAVGDVDDDGADDVIVALAPGAGHPARVQIYKRGLVLTDQRGIAGLPYGLVAVDVSNDKLADIIALSRLGSEMGPPGGSPRDGPDGPGGPDGPKDQRRPAGPGGRDQDRTFVWLSEAGDMADPIIGPTLPSCADATVADMDGDGQLDLVLVTEDGGLTLLFGNGRGDFDPDHRDTSTRMWDVGATVTAIAAADVDGNGQRDLLLAAEDGSLHLLLQRDMGFADTRVQLGPSLRADTAIGVAEFDVNAGADVLLIVAGATTVTRLSQFPTAQLLARDKLSPSGNTATVTAMAIAVDSDAIVTGHADGSVSIWRTDDNAGRLSSAHAGRHHAHDDAITALAVSRDGYVATGTAGGATALWRIGTSSPTRRTLELVANLGEHEVAITAIDVVPQARMVAYGTAGDQLVIWHAARERGPDDRGSDGYEMSSADLDSVITAVAIGPPAARVGPPSPSILTGLADGTVVLWTSGPRETLEAGRVSHPAAVTALLVTPGVSRALSTDASGTVKLLGFGDGGRATLTLADTFESEIGAIARMHEVPRMKAGLAVSRSGTVAIWEDNDDGDGGFDLRFEIAQGRDRDGALFTVLTHGGQWLIALTDDGELEIWRVPIEYLN